jgi:hypothetical protein
MVYLKTKSIQKQTDGHGETSIPPYNFVVGGIKRVQMIRKLYYFFNKNLMIQDVKYFSK